MDSSAAGTADALALDDGSSHSVADWEAAAAAVLRKARRLGADDPDSDAWGVLTRTTLDGIDIAPLGTADLVADLVTKGRPLRTGDWDVRSLVDPGAPAEVNEAALGELAAGATSLLLAPAPDDDPAASLGASLAGVLLDVAPVALHRPGPAACEALADLLEAYDGTPAPGSNLSADPITTALLPQRADAENQAGLDEALVRIARRALDLGVLGVVVDGTALHDRGAGDAQELGWSMAAGVHYLRVLTGAGLSVDEAAGLIEFRYAVSDEQFPQIAKLRAARRLWARVLEASGGGDVAQRQHAITSRAMMTRHDPWVNMLRTTVAGFAAGVGGADAITVLAFDSALGRPGVLGRRVARNTSALLIEESHVAAVTDPAGGAYAVERLTDDLAVAGWAELQRIEADGGAAADAARTAVRERVEELARRRDAEVATRARPITGLSEFPDLQERLPEREPGPDGGVHARHWGWQFEDFRAEPASTPVFLATMGPLAAYSARAGFARNLFAAGGIEVQEAGPTEAVADVVEAYDGQPVVCLAGTDPAYAAWGAELVGALRDAGAGWVVVAGKPSHDGQSLGVDDSCAVGVDAVAFLTTTREKLGMEEEQ